MKKSSIMMPLFVLLFFLIFMFGLLKYFVVAYVLLGLTFGLAVLIFVLFKKELNRINAISHMIYEEKEYFNALEEIDSIHERKLFQGNYYYLRALKVSVLLLLENEDVALHTLTSTEWNNQYQFYIYYSFLLNVYFERLDEAEFSFSHLQKIKNKNYIEQKNIAIEIYKVMHGESYNKGLLENSLYPIVQKIMKKY